MVNIEKQIKGFIRLEDNFFIEYSKCELREIKSKNGKISKSYVYENEIITKYKWRYIIECECNKEINVRKDHYNEYYKNNKKYLCSSCQQKGDKNRFWSSKNPINWTAKSENEIKKGEAYKKQSLTKSKFTQDKRDEINKKIFTPKTKQNISNSVKNAIKVMKAESPEKYIEWRSKLKGNIKKSKAHKRVESQLNLLDINYKSEHKIEGKRLYRYDIFVPSKNLLIEINGDKVHANPLKYKADDIVKDQWRTTTAKERWDYDSEKKLYAEDQNYNTLTIWSSNIFKKDFNISKLINQP